MRWPWSGRGDEDRIVEIAERLIAELQERAVALQAKADAVRVQAEEARRGDA